MNFHFKLMLVAEIKGKRKKIYAAEFLHEKKVNGKLLKVDPQDSTIDLFYQGQSYISPTWNLGRVDWLLPQFRNALFKLENNELVMVRSAVIEGSEVPYLICEPNYDLINLSLIFFEDSQIEQIFPSGPFSERSDELYQYFQANKDKIFGDLTAISQDNPGFNDYFIDLKIPAEQFLNNLKTCIKELEDVLFEMK